MSEANLRVPSNKIHTKRSIHLFKERYLMGPCAQSGGSLHSLNCGLFPVQVPPWSLTTADWKSHSSEVIVCVGPTHPRKGDTMTSSSAETQLQRIIRDLQGLVEWLVNWAWF